MLIATCTKDYNNTIIPGHKRAPKADFGQTNWGWKIGDRDAPTLLFARLLC